MTTGRSRHPWLRPRRLIAVAAVALALWLIWHAFFIITGRTNPTEDFALRLHELSAAAQPEGVNGWPALTEADRRVSEADSALRAGIDMSAAIASDDSDAVPWLDNLLVGPIRLERWGPQIEAIEQLRQDGTLDLLRQVAQADRCVMPPVAPGPLGETYFPSRKLTPLRHLTRFQAPRLRLAAHDGDWYEFTRIVDEGLAIARFISFQPTILERLVAEACAGLILTEVRTTLLEYTLDETTCLELLAVVERRLPLAPVSLNIEGERMVSMDTFQHAYTTSGRLPLNAFGKYRGQEWAAVFGSPEVGPVEGAINDTLAIIFPGRAQAERMTNEYWDGILARVDLPLTELQGEDFDTDEWLAKLPRRQVLLRHNRIVSFDRMLRGAITLRSETKATRLLLAVEAHRARLGDFPPSLEHLVPEFLSALPVDPVNGLTFGYRLISDDVHGRPYLIYSFGVDGVDDGGAADRFGSHWQWTNPQYSGIDRVFNLPRHPLR